MMSSCTTPDEVEKAIKLARTWEFMDAEATQSPIIDDTVSSLLERQARLYQYCCECRKDEQDTIGRLQAQVKELEKRNDYLRKAQASTYRDGELLRAQVKELEAPVLPDDVAEAIQYLQGSNLGSLRKIADLMERQAREIQDYRQECGRLCHEVGFEKQRADSKQQRIEELKAALEGIAARRDCFGGINGCGAASTARAALQENEY